jgi:hypothetical protein
VKEKKSLLHAITPRNDADSTTVTIVRRDALSSAWSELRDKVPSLGVPPDYVGDERVLCIAITNIMDFTGHSRDGVVVTDDSCFFRFFGERVIRKHTSDGSVNEEMEPIRASQNPHPWELMPYLHSPYAMRLFTDKMTLLPHIIPAITKGSPGFFSVHVEFDPSRDGGIHEWTPAFVSDKAYAIATMLCRTRQPIALAELQKDQELLNAANALAEHGIIARTVNDSQLLQINLENPICVRLPDKRYAVGENRSGQMAWWLGKHFPDKTVILASDLVDYLANQTD